MTGRIAAGLQWFWNNHVQKTFATLIGGSAAFDLVNDFLQYGEGLSDLIGPRLYHTLRLVSASIMLARAVIQPRHKEK